MGLHELTVIPERSHEDFYSSACEGVSEPLSTHRPSWLTAGLLDEVSVIGPYCYGAGDDESRRIRSDIHKALVAHWRNREPALLISAYYTRDVGPERPDLSG